MGLADWVAPIVLNKMEQQESLWDMWAIRYLADSGCISSFSVNDTVQQADTAP